MKHQATHSTKMKFYKVIHDLRDNGGLDILSLLAVLNLSAGFDTIAI